MTVPLHEEIRSDFERRILSGELAPGDRLPTEQALMQVYGCSRMTVNKALSALTAAGFVERRRKAGTSVARPKVHSMILDVPDIAEQIAARGQAYRYRPLMQVVRDANGSSAEERRLAEDGALMQIDGLHLADDVPLCVEYRLVSVSAVPAIVDADFRSTAPGTWLLRHIPWTEAESRISAVAASSEVASKLDIPTGAACLCIERQTWRDAQPVTSVRQLFRGEAYDLVAKFGATQKTAKPA